jgi:repressor LexA
VPRKHLTAKQYEFLHYLRRYVEQNRGVWPTYREIVEYFGYRSPNSVTQNLQALARKGYLSRDGDQYALVGEQHAPRGIPVLGTITAGRLQEAVEENLGTITLETLFPNLHRLFALRVRGQSMQGADIHDGDYVLLVDDDIPQGGIGAVLYEGETTLKRVYMDEGGLRLEPCNEEFDAIQIAPDVFQEVRILGRYVGHVNRTGIHRRSPAYARAA